MSGYIRHLKGELVFNGNLTLRDTTHDKDASSFSHSRQRNSLQQVHIAELVRHRSDVMNDWRMSDEDTLGNTIKLQPLTTEVDSESNLLLSRILFLLVSLTCEAVMLVLN